MYHIYRILRRRYAAPQIKFNHFSGGMYVGKILLAERPCEWQRVRGAQRRQPMREAQGGPHLN